MKNCYMFKICTLKSGFHYGGEIGSIYFKKIEKAGESATLAFER
jgi:hypothetical protein